jgi:hypothetical protein
VNRSIAAAPYFRLQHEGGPKLTSIWASVLKLQWDSAYLPGIRRQAGDLVVLVAKGKAPENSTAEEGRISAFAGRDQP